VSKSAIRTLERQALEAMRQAAEPGCSAAAQKSCLETAISAMRSVKELQHQPRRKAKRKAKRKAGAPARRQRQLVLVS
jgi:hypothetical protein